MTVREALDHGDRFVGLPFKYLSGRITVVPKSGPFKGKEVSLWDILEEKSRSTTKKLSVTSKSWAGDVVEGIFGVPKNSSSSKDLGFLELKTFGIAAKGAGEIPKTMEANLKLSAFSWQSVNDMDFNSSSLHQKILQQLWVPLLKPPRAVNQDQELREQNKKALEWMGQFTMLRPMIWIPTKEDIASMQSEYESVREKVREGEPNEVSMSKFPGNRFLVPNTGGKDSKTPTTYVDGLGNSHRVKTRSWMLRSSVVQGFFERQHKRH
jgi:hypothetical protein